MKLKPIAKMLVRMPAKISISQPSIGKKFRTNREKIEATTTDNVFFRMDG